MLRFSFFCFYFCMVVKMSIEKNVDMLYNACRKDFLSASKEVMLWYVKNVI